MRLLREKARILACALLQAALPCAYAEDASSTVEPAGTGFTVVVLAVMLVMVIAPIIWWWIRESRGKKADPHGAEPGSTGQRGRSG